MTGARGVPARVPARKTLAAAVALVATAPLLSGCFEEPSAHEAVRDFLVGWQSGDYLTAARRTDGDPAVVAKALEDVRLQLDAASLRFKLTGVSRTGDGSEAGFRAEVDLGENNPLWVYQGRLPLHLVNGTWKVRWSPSVLHPQLKEGQRFAVPPSSDSRQPVLDRNREPLQRDAELYVAGVTPVNLKDPERLCEELSEVTGFAQDRLLSRIRSAPPNELAPLVTFGIRKYLELRPKLEAIQGIKIIPQKQPVDPDAPTQIVGRVSAVTPESEQQLGGPQRAGDSVGLSGLQKAYQDQLTGATAIRVITLDLKTGKEVAELAKWEGRPNTSVLTTIDTRVQGAAETAMSSASVGAMVAVKASTGEILAVSTRRLHQEKDALAGKFPAGSVFSIVAADALLKSGVTAKQRLPCPVERSVGGARFQQTAGPVIGTPTFQGSVANGCVTALAALGRRVDALALQASAESFGIGSDWQLPLKSFSGSMPKMAGNAARAKAIVGQNVRVSPLTMALIAGAVKHGTWHPPLLVKQPASPDPEAETAPARQPDPIKLDPKRVAALRALMRAGVAKGTAATANANGSPVHGITTGIMSDKSWFIGYQDDVAVAVLTENADPAAIAGRFFHLLHATA
ncbi:penicillin-binding transpeptidase domain-containing protein [Spongiactinospora sp. TRM90649]|uniref:penicillin-binding transpeptidase domain-containing protein n=1 Tax=Spongiactinospora sp. TRM90649 TaxID=3031114 RepID=UPI0023F85EAC|nr:penicillin-binding transpeptidase domain-containing protein [Spongiactinospora sp. TRM90649]MDF5751107.1 penicillin-binding transpeptidase domain-containing protein [Spongiactinospora sp. TRM90649]